MTAEVIKTVINVAGVVVVAAAAAAIVVAVEAVVVVVVATAVAAVVVVIAVGVSEQTFSTVTYDSLYKCLFCLLWQA